MDINASSIFLEYEIVSSSISAKHQKNAIMSFNFGKIGIKDPVFSLEIGKDYSGPNFYVSNIQATDISLFSPECISSFIRMAAKKIPPLFIKSKSVEFWYTLGDSGIIEQSIDVDF